MDKLKVYGSSFEDPRWQALRPEILCTVRRARPTNHSRAELLLVVTWGLVRMVLDERREATVAEALNTLDIERYLRTCPPSTVCYRRPALSALLSVAHGLPDLRQTPTGRAFRLSEVGKRWLQQAEAATPMNRMLAEGVSTEQLRAISTHLPAGEIHSHREVLRG